MMLSRDDRRDKRPNKNGIFKQKAWRLGYAPIKRVESPFLGYSHPVPIVPNGTAFYLRVVIAAGKNLGTSMIICLIIFKNRKTLDTRSLLCYFANWEL
jgi:hypothetical protein